GPRTPGAALRDPLDPWGPLSLNAVRVLILRRRQNVRHILTRQVSTEGRSMQSSTSVLQSLIKRAFDIVVATGGLLLLFPLILVICAGLMIDSSGPILYRRRRYNSNNVEFEIFEFRTWLAGRQEKTFHDKSDEMQSLTRVGQILRDSGMNRLPVLLNVLRGEISIVGSRLFEAAPGKALPPIKLYEVRPGVVSLAHVNHDHSESHDEAKKLYRCIKCDLYYIDHCSFLFDMKIILRALLSRAT